MSTETDFDQPAEESPFIKALLEVLAEMGIYGKAAPVWLAAAIDRDKSNVYRVLKGKQSLSIEHLFILAGKGVNIVRVMEKAFGVSHPPGLLKATQDGYRCLVRVEDDENLALPYRLSENGEVKPSSELEPGDKPISSIHYLPEKHTLAILDDDPNVLSALSLLLSPYFEISRYSLATDLIQALSSGSNFKVMVLDWRLPDMDGNSMLSAVTHLSTSPILIMTGDQDDPEATKWLRHKHNRIAYFTKPVKSHTLISQLLQMVEQSN